MENKKIKKIFLIGILIALLIISSGCIEIKVTDSVSAAGQITREMNIDLSKINSEIPKNLLENGTYCGEILKSENAPLGNEIDKVNCSESMGKIKLFGIGQVKKEQITTDENGNMTYEFEIGAGIKISDKTMQEIKEINNEEIILNYEIIMPTEIISTSHGIIKDKKIVINTEEILSMESGEKITIKSKSPTAIPEFFLIIIAISGIVIVILVIILYSIISNPSRAKKQK